MKLKLRFILLLCGLITLLGFQKKQQTYVNFPKILFDNKATELDSTAKKKLMFVVRVLKDNPNYVIQVDGHADSSEGTHDVKVALSGKRAEACKKYIISQG